MKKIPFDFLVLLAIFMIFWTMFCITIFGIYKKNLIENFEKQSKILTDFKFYFPND